MSCPLHERKRLLWLAAAASVLSGCPRVPPADLSRDPVALLGEVRAAQARVRTVRGTARVHIESPGLSGTVTEFAAVEKPDRVRLETLDFFGNPAAVLVADRGAFAFLDVRAGVFYRGKATPENVSRLLPFVIPVEELVTILCGSAPLLPGTPLDVNVDGGLLLLTLGRGDTGQRLAIGEAASVEWSRVRRTTGEGAAASEAAPAYDLEFDDFRRRGGVRFPTRLELDAPAGRAHIRLSWRDDVELNAPLEPSLFRLRPPKGARVVDLEGDAAAPRSRAPGTALDLLRELAWEWPGARAGSRAAARRLDSR
jgi:outer membrane biogenesis lipoprotein LolB